MKQLRIEIDGVVIYTEVLVYDADDTDETFEPELIGDTYVFQGHGLNRPVFAESADSRMHVTVRKPVMVIVTNNKETKENIMAKCSKPNDGYCSLRGSVNDCLNGGALCIVTEPTEKSYTNTDLQTKLEASEAQNKKLVEDIKEIIKELKRTMGSLNVNLLADDLEQALASSPVERYKLEQAVIKESEQWLLEGDDGQLMTAIKALQEHNNAGTEGEKK